MSPLSNTQELVLLQDGKPLRIAANSSGIHIKLAGRSTHFPWWNVLWVEFKDDKLHIHAIKPGVKSARGRLFSVSGGATSFGPSVLQDWAQDAMQHAYPNTKPGRRFKVLVNPHSGKGKSNAIFHRVVRPFFAAAHCDVDVLFTTRGQHAYETVKEIPLQYDAIVTVSGDGMVHECVNGLSDHTTPDEALRIPIAPIPTGSGNALCVNLLGTKYAGDIDQACLNAIKGRPMSIDLCLLTSGEQRVWSFLSQTMGLMAELDLGTEHLRWLGQPRFMYGYFKGLVWNRDCPVKLEFKQPQKDLAVLLSAWNTHSTTNEADQADAVGHPQEVPPTENGSAEEEWVSFGEPYLHCIAGKVPYISSDLMPLPLALPTDGYLDVVIQCMTSRLHLLRLVEAGKTGQMIYDPSVRYLKVKGLRLTPLKPEGVFSVDGESHPFKPVEVEVHRGKARVLSPNGHYVQDFAGRQLNGTS